MSTALNVAVIAAAVTVLVVALHAADQRARRRAHDRDIDEILARRYQQQTALRGWYDTTFSVPTPVRDLTTRYGAGVGTDTFEQTAHAARQEPSAHRSVEHAGTKRATPPGRRQPTPPRGGAPDGGVGLLDPRRDTTPHPSPGRRRI